MNDVTDQSAQSDSLCPIKYTTAENGKCYLYAAGGQRVESGIDLVESELLLELV